MAYRNLDVGDIVKIVDNGPHHGMIAQVEPHVFSGNPTNVFRVKPWNSNVLIWVNKKNLLVAEMPHKGIYDGKLDIEAKKKYDDEISLYLESLISEWDNEDSEPEACGDCECCRFYRQK